MIEAGKDSSKSDSDVEHRTIGTLEYNRYPTSNQPTSKEFNATASEKTKNGKIFDPHKSRKHCALHSLSKGPQNPII